MADLRLLLVVLVAAGCSTASGVAPDAAAVPDASEVLDAAPDPDANPEPTGLVLGVFGDDYGNDIVYAPFGGSSNGPSIDGVDPHSGSTSLRIEVPAAGYTGGAFRSAVPVDLSGFPAVTFWARASRPATLNVVGLGNDATTTTYWAEWNAIPLSTTWTRHVVPVPDPALLTAERGVFHVAEGSDEGTYTLWLDDIRYEVTPDGLIGAARPAIATEPVGRPVGQTFLVNGCSVTTPVGGVDQTIATSRRYFTFQSSDPAVASVDADGLVTALSVGSTTITARLGDLDAIGALTFQVTP